VNKGKLSKHARSGDGLDSDWNPSIQNYRAGQELIPADTSYDEEHMDVPMVALRNKRGSASGRKQDIIDEGFDASFRHTKPKHLYG